MLCVFVKVQTLSTAQPEQIAAISSDIVNNLAAITKPVESTSALPLDLGAVADVLDTVLRYCN